MKAELDFDPISPDEVLNLPLDFTKYLSAGDTLQSVVVWNCTVAASSPTQDSAPATRLTGPATLDATKTKVLQTVHNCVAGAIYVMEAVAQTAAGETLSLWAFIECKAAGTL